MRLFWYDRPGGNFGDDLNPWLWPKLLPGLLDGRGAWLVGIGTLLNERLPAGDLVVLGAGAGLGATPVVSPWWRVLGVRGPLTAAALGLPPDLAIGDPAILVADHWPAAPARRGVGLMPHYASLAHWDWRATAERLGLVYVSPEAPVETTLAQIAGLDALVTEAMHGAIVADALRTPWVAVRIDPDFHAPKWRDWGLSVGIEPAIHRVPALSAARASARDTAKRLATALGLGAGLTPPPPPASPRATVAAAEAALARLAAHAPRQLSTDAALATAQARVRASVARLLADPPRA